MAIPLIILFAVVRYQFLDIDIIIRRSLIYGILAGIVVGLYLVAGLLIGQRFEEHPSAWALVLLVVGLGAGVMFSPSRNWIGRWVDRTFFKMRHDYGLALAAVGRELESASSQTEIARILVGFFERTLQPVPRGVVLGEDPAVAAGTLSSSQASALVDQLGKSLRGTVAAPDTTSLPEIETPDFPEAIRDEAVVLVQPIHPERGLEGFILLGAKASGWRYIDTDIDLIQSVAEAAGTTLERIRLVQTVSAETLARQRLAELNRLKNDFLSRVAHDLRTPLASITWSTENLLDGVTGELTPAQAEYLISIKTSAIHLNRLVSNLLEISRLEQGTSDLELESMDLAPVIEQAATTLKPMARERDVEIRVHVDDEVAMVQANPGKVFEVAMNLIDNAVKYSPPGTAVDILVERLDDGRPGFSVRDRGPGFDPQDAQKLFERFQQGDPSPHSQQHGFGLGLYIVKSYLSLMNGDVEARVHPEGGAIFTCVLTETTSIKRNEE
jgi:signal transduction histidine kinase